MLGLGGALREYLQRGSGLAQTSGLAYARGATGGRVKLAIATVALVRNGNSA